MDELVSIIVPLYNVKDYLCKCVDSILAQTYRNIELLLVDDGSDDGSQAICECYREKDSRVRVFHIDNAGPSVCRNTGIKNACGKWLSFIDGDDFIEPTMISDMVCTARDMQVDLICFGFDRVSTDGSIYERFQIESSGICGKNEAMLLLAENKIGNYVWNKFYRADLFSDIQFPTHRLWEDIDVAWRVIEKANRIYIFSEIYYHYVKRANSIVHTINKQGYIDIFEFEYDEYCFMVENYPDAAQKLLDHFASFAFLFCMKFCWDVSQKENYKKAVEISKLKNQNTLLYKFFTHNKLIFKLLCRVLRKAY